MAGRSPEKIPGHDAQSIGDPPNVVDTHVPLASFDASDVGAIDPNSVRQVLLTPTLRLTKSADPCTKCATSLKGERIGHPSKLAER